MNFEKHKFENTENEVNIISLVQKIEYYQDGDGCTHEISEILCAFLSIEEAEKYRDELRKEKHKHRDIHYDSFSVEWKSAVPVNCV